MREIKFRVWDEKKKEMVYPTQFELNHYSDGEPTQLSWEWEYDSWSRSSEKIMQYTGLKDKNGLEIYEGDIVLHNDREDDKLLIGYSKIVPWFILINKNGYEYLPSIEDYDRLTVIGNIHENPELMEGI